MQFSIDIYAALSRTVRNLLCSSITIKLPWATRSLLFLYDVWDANLRELFTERRSNLLTFHPAEGDDLVFSAKVDAAG